MRRLAALGLILCWPAVAYYHFVRYAAATGPFVPIYDRFDLRTIPGGAVPYLISLNGPLTLAPGDSETALVSQIRAAAEVWSRVPTSEIRLVFGGFREETGSLSTPFIQVEFTDELPPGVIAQGGPVSRLDPAEGPNGPFTPIARSVLRLPKDLSSRPSWSERFFLTVVHEFGHTLGLQHTWTSGVMSTEVTRATTKAQPLAQDDIAAISLLYPAPEFRASTGVISGRVTMNGQGVALASVVALVSGRTAVSALTAPDGTYRIEGLLPGSYFVYAHPLPPSIAGEPLPVNLELPETPAGRVPPGPPFHTVFYPGTPTPSSTVSVEAGKEAKDIDFQVEPLSQVTLHSVQTYSFYNRNAIKPAILQISSDWHSIVFTGYGASSLSPGLSLSILNAPEMIVPGSLREYAQGYLWADVRFSPFSGEGPRHLLFQLNGESFILPSGLVLVRTSPPSITSVMPQPDGWLLVEGANLDARTSFWVDGVPARVKIEDGSVRILPPPASPTHTGTLVALNPDGQSSLMAQGGAVPVVSYSAAAQPDLQVDPLRIPAGSETVVVIRGSGLDLRQWPVWLGSGASDVTVRKIRATGESTAVAWLAASPSAQPSVTGWSAGVGLFTLRLPQTVTVTAPDATPYVRMSELESQYIHPGGTVVLPLANAPLGLSVPAVKALVGGLAAIVLDLAEGAVKLRVPPELQPGVHRLELNLAGIQALPAAIEVRPVPLVVLGAARPDGTAIMASASARPGDTIILTVANLGEAAEIPPALVTVSTGRVTHPVRSVRPNPDQPGTHLIEVLLADAEPGDGQLPLTVAFGEAYNLEPFLLPFHAE